MTSRMPSTKPLILVVDDDAKTVASVRLYLEHAGCAVISNMCRSVAGSLTRIRV